MFLSSCWDKKQNPAFENTVFKEVETSISLPEKPIEMKEVETNTSDQNCIIFDDFSEEKNYRWGIVNDWVMWGKSQGSFEIVENTLVFSGTINTNGWGFSSLRWTLESGIPSEYNSITLKAKSDGRGYKVTFRDANNSRVSHQAIIPFQTPWEFEEVTIPFTALEPSYFGRIVNTDAFSKDKAQQVGVILSDGMDGAFRLKIEEVRFCK